MRWKLFSGLIVISLFWPVCGYAQSQKARPKAPASQPAAATEQTTQVHALGNARPGPSGAAGAKANGAQTPIDPQLKADILRLFAVMDMEAELKRAAQGKVGRLQSLFYSFLPDTPHREQIADEAATKLTGLMSSPEFENKLVVIYAKYFNDKQMKTLVQIFQSPVWRHYQAVQASLGQDARQAGEQFAIEHVPIIFVQMCPKYPELQGKAKFCPAVPANTPAPASPAPSGPAATK